MNFQKLSLDQQADKVFAMLPDNCKMTDESGLRLVKYPSQLGRPSLSARPGGWWSLDNFQRTGEHCYQAIYHECLDMMPVPVTNYIGNMPVVTTTEGLRIMNFSSPHAFSFTDGTVLVKCEDHWSKDTMMAILESTDESGVCQSTNKFETIELSIHLTPVIQTAIDQALQAQRDDLVDVVIVPLMVLNALREIYDREALLMMPFRTVRMADRITKVSHHNKFCL